MTMTDSNSNATSTTTTTPLRLSPLLTFYPNRNGLKTICLFASLLRFILLSCGMFALKAEHWRCFLLLLLYIVLRGPMINCYSYAYYYCSFCTFYSSLTIPLSCDRFTVVDEYISAQMPSWVLSSTMQSLPCSAC